MNEWCWDYYDAYDPDQADNPTGPVSGTRHVYRGGGRFGQSLTAIAKLAPDANIGEGLSVHYFGGSGLPANVTAWLEKNNIEHG